MSEALELAAHLLGDVTVEAGRPLLGLVDGRPVTVAVACDDAAAVAARRGTPLVLIDGDCGPVRLPGGQAVVRVDGSPLGLAAADLSVGLGDAALVDHPGLSPAAGAELTRRFLSLLPATGAAHPPAGVRRLTERVPLALDGRYEVEAVLDGILDGGEGWIELRRGVAPEVVTGLGRLGGIGIGIVASRAAVDAAG